MNQKLLQEATAAPTSTARGLWRAVLITPGRGSSGNWEEETIRRDGPHVLKAGARCFVTHNREQNGEPNPFMMWGVLASDSFYDENANDGKGGLVADIQVLNSWIEKVEEVAPHTALSVFLMGESDEYGNITRILEDPQNGVDMVVYPGREGSALVEKLYESARQSARIESQNNPAVKSAAENEPKGLSLMEKDVQDAFDAINAKIDAALGSKQVEAEAKATEDAIATAVEAALKDHAEKAKTALAAVEAAKADLLPSQIATLNESALKGEDVTASIESLKQFNAEAKTHFVEAAKVDEETRESGRVGETLTEGYVLGSGFRTNIKENS
ncbi:capsid maturation protease [Microbacterium phage Hortus1]|nr:capsid maturation protease [Microbacterium phage Hortus1]AWY05604.1 capsid maturation protease [Microbacterium phage OlinDD]